MKEKYKTASLTLCIISNVILALNVIFIPIFMIMWVMSALSHNMGAGDSLGALIFAGCFGFVISLVLAIIAKCLNTKSIYAIVCIILSAIPVVLTVVAGIGIANYVRMASEQLNEMQRAEALENYSGEWEEEVQACLDSHQFDKADVNFGYKGEDGYNGLVILIYVSRDVQQDKIDEVNAFLLEMRDLCFAFDEIMLVVPCYYEPGNGKLEYATYLYMDGATPDNLTDIDMNRDTSVIYSWYRPDHLPDSADECNILIVLE